MDRADLFVRDLEKQVWLELAERDDAWVAADQLLEEDVANLLTVEGRAALHLDRYFF